MLHRSDDSDDDDLEDDPFANGPSDGDDAEDDEPEIDRQIRINELKERARELAGGNLTEGKLSDDLPPEIEEQFWKQVVDFESSDWTTGLERLERIGVELPEPEELTEEELVEKLREVIGAMASIGMYLVHTDHLSDRELYEHLIEDLLLEESPEMPGVAGCWTYDLVSSGSDEDNEAYLRYYADENYRQEWAESFPEDVIPPHEDPKYDRDSKLPSGFTDIPGLGDSAEDEEPPF